MTSVERLRERRSQSGSRVCKSESDVAESPHDAAPEPGRPARALKRTQPAPSTRTAILTDMIGRMTTPAPKSAAGLGRHGRDAVSRPARTRSALDCGRELSPIRIAYETYGTLSPARDNVILVCHALSGDAHAAGYSADAGRGEHARRLPRRGARCRRRPRPRLVGRHDRSRQGLRHRSLLRRQLEPARRLPRHDRALVDRPGDRPALRRRTSR